MLWGRVGGDWSGEGAEFRRAHPVSSTRMDVPSAAHAHPPGNNEPYKTFSALPRAELCLSPLQESEAHLSHAQWPGALVGDLRPPLARVWPCHPQTSPSAPPAHTPLGFEKAS